MSYINSIRFNKVYKIIFLAALLSVAALSKAFGSNIHIHTDKLAKKSSKKSLKKGKSLISDSELSQIEKQIKAINFKYRNQLVYSSPKINNSNGIAIIISDWHKVNEQDKFGSKIHKINSKTLVKLIEEINPDYTLMEGSTNTPKGAFKLDSGNLENLIEKVSVASAVGEIYLSKKGHKFYPAEKNSEMMQQLLYFLVQDSPKKSQTNFNYSVRGVASLLFDFESKQVDAEKLKLWKKMLNQISKTTIYLTKNISVSRK